MTESRNFHTVRGYQLLEQNKRLLTPAMEDYLEMIYRNSLEEDYLRINSLAELLNVKASSATKMVQKLARLELIDYKKYGIIQLTESGREIGRFLLHRHNVTENFLQFLGVRDRILVETELIEHNISIDTLELIDSFNRFVKENPEFTARFERFKEQDLFPRQTCP
jgi:Mn-dependent DtxR family transcriptional regulator